jgi:ribosomal protein S13
VHLPESEAQAETRLIRGERKNMARIVGVDIPNEKRVVIALPIFTASGPSLARKICKDANVSEDIRVKNLTDEQLVAIRARSPSTRPKAIFAVKSRSTSSGSKKSAAIVASVIRKAFRFADSAPRPTLVPARARERPLPIRRKPLKARA